MSSPVIWNGTSAKLLNSGKIIDKDGVPFIQQKEINYIKNGSAHANIAGWTAISVGDPLAVTRSTTDSELPREFTTCTGIKIIAPAGDPEDSYVFYDFTLDDVDLNKKLKIQWAQKQFGSYVAGDLEVVITTQADRTTAIATPDITAIPAYDGVFTASFDTASTATLSLVIRATTDMATDAGIVISDVIVGPGQIMPVPAIGPEQSYTPTISGLGSGNASITYAKWWRVGEKMRIRAYLTINSPTGTADIGMSLPTGHTTSAHAESNTNLLGGGMFFDASIPQRYPLVPKITASGQSSIFFEYQSGGASSAITSGTVQNGDVLLVDLEVGIAEWAGAPNYAAYGNNFIGASAHRNNVALNLAPNNSTVQVPLNSVASTSDAKGWNIGNAYDTTNSGMTIPASGKYLITSNIMLSAGNILNSAYALVITRGSSPLGTQIATLNRNEIPGAGNPLSLGGSTVLDLNAGDKIYLALFGTGNNSINQLAVDVSPGNTYWEISRLTDAAGTPVVGFGEATLDRLGLVKPSFSANATAQSSYSSSTNLVRSGTYTPTATSSANLDSNPVVSANSMQWTQIGRVVMCSGFVAVDPTSNNTATSFTLTLPVIPTSNFAANIEANGTAVFQVSGTGSNGTVGTAFATISAKTVTVGFYATDTSASRNLFYQFQYVVN